MAATILGGLWVSGLKGQTNMTSVHHQFMSALATYIQGNVTFVGTFSGVNPSGTPLTTAVVSNVNPGSLASEMSTCAEHGTSDGYAQWKAWIMGVYSFITKDCGLLPGAFIPFSPIPCFKLVSPKTWDRPDLLNAIKGKENSPQDPTMDRMAQGFMDDMRIDFVPVFPGQVGAYTGAFTVSSVQTP
jgi:hypothetical protein